MLRQGRVTGFIPTKSFGVAKAFYGETLGLKLIAEEPYALVFECGGTRIRVVEVKAYVPFAFTLLGWEVDDLERTVTALAKGGVAFERYPWMEQDSLGIWTAPNGAQVAWFKDPDGNVLSLACHARETRVTR